MKKTALAVAVSTLAVLMVLPVVRSVNLLAGKSVTINRAQFADGAPMPPIPPKPPSMRATLVADGSPMPPPIPPKPPSLNSNALVADGAPMPPPIPPKPPQSRILG